MPSVHDDQRDTIRFFRIDREAEPPPVHRERTRGGCILGIVTIAACNLLAIGAAALIYTLVR